MLVWRCLRNRCQNRIRWARGELGVILVRENGEEAGEAGKAIKLVFPFRNKVGRKVEWKSLRLLCSSKKLWKS